MSRYTYEGKFMNPTEGFHAQETREGIGYVWVRERVKCDCGCPNCKHYNEVDRLHTMHGDPEHPVKGFEGGAEEAEEWIEAQREFFEEDYDNYLEEHHDDIVRQERYEQWRNEY